jgi:two-component sensor histidine kinase
MERQMAAERAAMESRFEGDVHGEPRIKLEEVAVRGLQKLEHLVSMIRHSLVEICFQNLKLNAKIFVREEPASERADAAWLRLAKEFDELPATREKLTEYFATSVDDKFTVRDIFPDVERTVVSVLDTLVDGAPARPADTQEVERRAIADSLPRAVDEIMAALGTVRPALDEAKTELTSFLAAHCETLSTYCEGKNIVFKHDIAETPCRVFARKESLKDAIGELVRNATKYASPQSGDGLVRLSFRKETKHGRWAVIAVEDSGPGMTEDELTKVRGRVEIESHCGGHGLPMVYRTIEDEHNGRVDVGRSDLGGMRFMLWLPTRFRHTR